MMMEIEFKETEDLETGRITGTGGVCFKAEYTITDEASVRDLGDQMRKMHQEHGRR